MSLGIRGLAYLVHVVSLVCALVNCGRHIIFCVRLLDGEILFFLNFFFLSRMVGCWHTAISKGVPIFCFGVVKIRNLSHSLLRRHEKKKKNDSCEIEIMFFFFSKIIFESCVWCFDRACCCYIRGVHYSIYMFWYDLYIRRLNISRQGTHRPRPWLWSWCKYQIREKSSNRSKGNATPATQKAYTIAQA